MLSYMRCLKTSSADRDSGKCRSHAKAYLECRMDNGLMQRDDFENLGLGDVDSANPTGAKAKAGFVPGAPGGSGMAGVGTGGGAAGTGAAAGAGKAEQERI
jgi:hypothetical protein